MRFRNTFYLNVFYLSALFVILLLKNRSTVENQQNSITGDENSNKLKAKHFIINSAFYYSTSKFYDQNTLTILFNAEIELPTENSFLKCFSKNATSTLITPAQIRSGNQKLLCSWHFFIANCSTVLNPIYIGLTTVNETLKEHVELKFEYPVRRQYPVIMCYPPMVYETRWQQIIFATEIYHHFGTDLQIQYINSAMTEIVDILKIYSKKGWIKMQPFAFADLNLDTILEVGVHPMLELDSRNQGLAYTDCLMRYRESAEFIIVADVDDVLFPSTGSSYFEEFLHWKKLHPLGAAFFYMRSFAKIDVEQTFTSMALLSTIKSLRVHNETIFGKSVYVTKYAETAGIHAPGMPYDTIITIPPEQSRMFHVQINDKALEGANSTTFKPFNGIPKNILQKISNEFVSTFRNISSFNRNTAYPDAILQCYMNYAKWILSDRKLPMPKYFQCLNPLKCRKPKTVPNLKCTVARRDYIQKKLNNGSIVLHLPNSNFYWWKNENGCNVFLN